MNYKTIEELYKDVKNGSIDESNLEIIIDTDSVNVCTRGSEEIDSETVCFIDHLPNIEEMFKLLFPKAMVDWC